MEYEQQQEQSDEDNEITSLLNKKANEFNVMQIRLETNALIKSIERYLRGAEIAYIENIETHQMSAQKVSFGYPLANEKGIQSIISWISMHINPHTVQGNFLTRNGFSEEFQEFMFHFHTDFAEHLMNNMYIYEIEETEYSGIVTIIRNMVERFLSRSIGNLERASYGETFKSVESISSQPRQGLLGGFRSK